ITDDFFETYADEFPCNKESSRLALDRFLEYLKKANLPLITIFEIQTLFYELTTNISNHSGSDHNESIVFTARIENNNIVMVFIDSGVAFNIVVKGQNYNPETASKDRKKNGFGLIMIHKLADKISYVRENDALNVTIIEKNWS
ncbi:MAG: ATP-binding protein, partial [Candidatus Zixiibacteriota bacterium]